MLGDPGLSSLTCDLCPVSVSAAGGRGHVAPSRVLPVSGELYGGAQPIRDFLPYSTDY